MRSKKSGFTLIEVTIFLAISGLLFFAVTIGVQNSINQQRRNDSVQSFMEYLRGVYSSVMNVQNNNDTAGTAEQAIYGKLVTFNGNEINAKTVVADATADGALGGNPIDVLKNNLHWKLHGDVDKYTLKWGAKIAKPKGSLLIVRSPITGSINTYWRDTKTDMDLSVGTFSKQEVNFCIDTGVSVKSDVRLMNDAKNASSIVLYTDEENVCD